MVPRRSGLGRGLESLIPAAVGPTDGAPVGDGPILDEVPIGSIEPNPHQPRKHFDEESLADLAASIREIGVLQPILIRPIEPGKYYLIAGERRWRAARRAGLATIPAIVRATDELASMEQALVENLHRQDLSPLEEASAYQQLLEDFGLTRTELAAQFADYRRRRGYDRADAPGADGPS